MLETYSKHTATAEHVLLKPTWELLYFGTASREGSATAVATPADLGTANLRAKILDFRGYDSSRILFSRGGILMSIGDVPDKK